MSFGSITEELLGLPNFNTFPLIPWTIYRKMHISVFKTMLIILSQSTRHANLGQDAVQCHLKSSKIQLTHFRWVTLIVGAYERPKCLGDNRNCILVVITFLIRDTDCKNNMNLPDKMQMRVTADTARGIHNCAMMYLYGWAKTVRFS